VRFASRRVQNRSHLASIQAQIIAVPCGILQQQQLLLLLLLRNSNQPTVYVASCRVASMPRRFYCGASQRAEAMYALQ